MNGREEALHQECISARFQATAGDLCRLSNLLAQMGPGNHAAWKKIVQLQGRLGEIRREWDAANKAQEVTR